MNPQNTFAAATRYYESGDLKKAGQLCQKILKHDPNHFEALFNFGNILKDLGKYTEALYNYSRAIRIRPNFPEVYYNLGLTLIKIGKYRAAEHSFELAIKMNPDFAEAYYYLGITQKDQEKIKDAIKNFSHAIQLNPEFTEAHNELGLALKRVGKYEQSEQVFRKILRLNPNYAIAYNNLANLLQKQGRFSEALSYSNHALDLVPNFYEALFSRSLLYLLKGNFEKGWLGFEYRWKLIDIHKKRFDKPQWRGESLNGKTIFLWAEQGLGDTIQFIRYVSLIKKCSGTVVVRCHPYLLEILSSIEGIDRLISKDEEAPDFDFHIPLLSLPGIFKTTLDTIPSDIPYINSPPEYKDKFHEILNQHEKLFKIGIVWGGNPRNINDHNRSCRLQYFQPLLKLDNVSVFSLQKGPQAKKLTEYLNGNIHNIGSLLHNFADTAAVVMNLDLVITVDTAVAHLAGALGKTVWVLLPFYPDWRWMLDRNDSPWYPTMRLFRQSKPGDWKGVFDQVKEALNKMITKEDIR